MIEPLTGVKPRLWTKAQIQRTAARIDRYMGKAESLARDIRDGHHGEGEAIGNALLDECFTFASAEAVVRAHFEEEDEDVVG